MHDGFEHFFDAESRFGADQDGFVGIHSDDGFDLLLDAVDFRAGQIDLVHDGNDRQVMVDGEIRIGQRLRFDALRRIDDQQRAFAGGKASGDFVTEIDVAGRIDQIEDVVLAVSGVVVQPDGFGFDRDAAFLLEIHVVENLSGHFALGERAGHFQQAIGKRGFAVIDVSDDRKISDVR